ncbi:MAG TPA: DUF4271 domain-containing protein [Hanamia sp.]|nr:DUF4271 domain-containing protein [Hanamia sp.]
MKPICCFALFACLFLCINASSAQNQNDSLLKKRQDTNHALVNKKPAAVKRNISDTVNEEKTKIPVLSDSNPSPNIASAKKEIPKTFTFQDTLKNKADSLADTAQTLTQGTIPTDSALLAKNRYIKSKSKPVSLIEHKHIASGKEFLFYTLCLVLLILGLFKTFFSAYFKNLFRVYFNTSLRQTQLSDQLQQATLPSLILNIFFTITAGIYIWLLFSFYHPPRLFSGKALLPFCILSIGVLYFLKFCVLKFMGWVSDVQESTNGYIFAIFLVNKITGIFLVPIIILLAFINRQWLPVITNISIMVLGLLFLSRYVKSYGVIEKKVPLNPFHFIIYIAGAEIIPLLILYKVAIDYLI